MVNEDRTALFVDRSLYWCKPVCNQYLRFDPKQRSWRWLSRRTMLVENPNVPNAQEIWELKGSPRDEGYHAELFDLFCFLENGQLEHVRTWQTPGPELTAVWRELVVTIPLGTA